MMKADLEFIPTRKAFSAERSKDSFSLCGSSNELEQNTFKVCSSASYLSARGKNLRERQLEKLLSEEFSPKSLRLDGKEDSKLFLNATQTLEKLSKIIAIHSTPPHGKIRDGNLKTEHSTSKKSNLKEIILYHDILKKLLQERCTLILKEECKVSIKRTMKLIEDFKYLYSSEKLKMMMMPIQTCNRFVSSSDIGISTLQLLIQKLNIICDLHSSIDSSYQKIINCFHVVLDLNLYQMVLKTNRILEKLKWSLFYWAYKSIVVFMQKLCLADPYSVSPEFLHNILESCQVFNFLVKDNKGLRPKYIKSYDLFCDYITNGEYKKLPFNLVLNYLAFFEAKVAAEKIVHFLSSTCKKCRQLDLKRKKFNDETVHNPESSTSDYCSASISDLGIEHSANSNFVNVLVSITQRNQSLVMKYLYAITSLQNSSSLSKVARRASHEIKLNPVRQTWKVPEQNVKDDICVTLEEKYWRSFWDNVQKFILKVLFEVPHHQYGDAMAGTIILWPDSFLHTLFECLKMSTESNDVTDEGRYIMKQIYEYILVQRIQVAWDKEFSSALTATHSHICTAVPTSLNQVRTHAGNLLFTCLDLVTGIFHKDHRDLDSLLFLQCLHHLQSTLDCFILWVNNKTRALISSRNLPTYLLISCSDCSSASKLLKDKAVPVISPDDYTNTCRRIPSTKYQLKKVIIKQVDILSGYSTEAPHLLYKVCFSTLKDAVVATLNYENSWKQCSVFGPKCIMLDTQESLTFPLTEVIDHISDTSPLLLAITSALAEALISSLRIIKKPISQNNIPLFRAELSKYFQWIDKLNVSETEKVELEQLHCMQRLNGILKLIESTSSQRQSCLRNRNRIMPIVESELLPHDSILSSQEREHWQKLTSRRIFYPCS